MQLDFKIQNCFTLSILFAKTSNDYVERTYAFEYDYCLQNICMKTGLVFTKDPRSWGNVKIVQNSQSNLHGTISIELSSQAHP